MKKNVIFMLVTAAIFAVSCGDSKKPAEEKPKTDVSMVQEEEGNVLEISGGDNMKFDKTELRAKAGETVKLVLIHSGKAAVTAMGHNVVILTQGTDATAFASEAMKAKDTDYIPQSMLENIVAHTKTIGGGETTEIEFVAPAAGEYDFLCTFPGHASMMKGKFIVE